MPSSAVDPGGEASSTLPPAALLAVGGGGGRGGRDRCGCDRWCGIGWRYVGEDRAADGMEVFSSPGVKQLTGCHNGHGERLHELPARVDRSSPIQRRGASLVVDDKRDSLDVEIWAQLRPRVEVAAGITDESFSRVSGGTLNFD